MENKLNLDFILNGLSTQNCYFGYISQRLISIIALHSSSDVDSWRTYIRFFVVSLIPSTKLPHDTYIEGVRRHVFHVLYIFSEDIVVQLSSP